MILFLFDWSLLRWQWQKGRVEDKAPVWVTVKYLGQYAVSLQFTIHDKLYSENIHSQDSLGA